MRNSILISIGIGLAYVLVVSSIVKADSDWRPLGKGSTIYVKDWNQWSLGHETLGATSFVVSKKTPSSDTKGNLLQVNCYDGSFRETYFQEGIITKQVEGNRAKVSSKSVPGQIFDFLCR